MGTQHTGLKVFVMGCSRGGTTLCQRLIAENLDLYTLPETRFFANLIGNLDKRMFPTTQRHNQSRRYSSFLREYLGLSTGQEYANMADMAVVQRRKWSSVSRISTDFVALLDQTAAQAGRAGWLEKTPFHVHYAKQIQKLIPDAWMIHIIRDPHETVASLWDVATKHPQSWGVNYDRIERAVDNWNAAVSDSTAMLGHAQQIFLPYAALAAAPQAAMAQIARQMNVPLTAKAKPSGQATLAKDTEQWKSAAIDGPVRPAVSKWATALSEDEQTRAEALIRPVPAALTTALAPFYELMPTQGAAS